MSKLKLRLFLKASLELLIVFFQFVIIVLHFFELQFLPKRQIIQTNPIFYFLAFLIILIASIIILTAIKDLGRNLTPFPRPKTNSKLVTTGVYRFLRHPMYYSLVLISLGVFFIKLSIYNLFLTICLALIIKFKIILEEQYLNIKFKNYLLYKNEVKY